MTDPQGICVIAEIDENKHPTSLTLELLGLGKELLAGSGENLSAVLLGSGISGSIQELPRYGADEVLTLDDPSLARYNPDIYQPVLEKYFRSRPHRLIMAGHTSLGQDLLPRLAFSLDSGLVTDCVGMEADDGGCMLLTKPVYGGNALATQRVKSATALATVRARVGEAPPPAEGTATVSVLDSGPPARSRIELKRLEKISDRECPLEEAPVVVSGGRGMGSEEGFALLRELASLLKGAVGASRPPVDSGWAPTTCQVGITGKVVAPDIYIAVAISGSTQHLSGMSESGKIVAINKDPEAYIFKVSDYGVVGDWKQVLPAFNAALKDIVSGEGA